MEAIRIINWHIVMGCIILTFSSCNSDSKPEQTTIDGKGDIFVEVLGIAQDAGYPQAGCMKPCCKELWNRPNDWEKVASIGIVDKNLGKTWIVDATPDFRDQLHHLQLNLKDQMESSFEGIFLTHAHIGHYTGLIHLGREVLGARQVPVYALPRMVNFLQTNGPWDQLVALKNVQLHQISADSAIQISESLRVRGIPVPHRDEYSETASFIIEGPNKKLLYIPDIDKWEKWDLDIKQMIQNVDYALLDGSFYQNGEIPGRDMSEIPHPFIEESMELFASLSPNEKAKIFFTHFNHTNPVLNQQSTAYRTVIGNGFNICYEGLKFSL